MARDARSLQKPSSSGSIVQNISRPLNYIHIKPHSDLLSYYDHFHLNLRLETQQKWKSLKSNNSTCRPCYLVYRVHRGKTITSLASECAEDAIVSVSCQPQHCNAIFIWRQLIRPSCGRKHFTKTPKITWYLKSIKFKPK